MEDREEMRRDESSGYGGLEEARRDIHPGMVLYFEYRFSPYLPPNACYDS